MTARTVTFLILAQDQARQNAWKVLPCCRLTATRCARCLPRAAQALLKFWQAASRSGAAQEHYGATPRDPTHPSVDVARSR